MGSVYLVERGDGQFAQTAALKLVRSGLDLEAITRRFERERQILASLTHPCIARLLDGGRTADGRPFFVMEYVSGQPIDRDCDERRLRITERLALFERLCRAVQHAHTHLVVHRDLKPSNVIVSPDGDVKLLDFGISRILEPASQPVTDATDVVLRILTPDYCSPEQVRGEPVAVGSDIYQLGLLLYELLTGERAQRADGASQRELERVVCESSPPRPSDRVLTATDATCHGRRATPKELARMLRGDLDLIVGCAMRKEVHRRYASVADLIEDLQRYARGLPIRARGEAVGYRVRKFAARHRAGLAAASAIAVTFALVFPLVAGQRLRAARGEERARQIEELLGRVFSLSSPAFAPRPPSAADFVDGATRLVRAELNEQPASRARLMGRLGRLYVIVGRYQSAVAVLSEALVGCEREFGGDSVEVADTLQALAQAQHYLAHYDKAESSLRRAAAILAARLPSSDLARLRLALDLGDLLHTRGQLALAEQTLRDAVNGLRSSSAPREHLARGLRDLGNVLRDRGAAAESAASYRESITLFGTLSGGRNRDVSVAELYYARLLVRMKAYDAAEELLVRDLRELRAIYGGGDHPLTAVTLATLGTLRTEQGRYDEADQFFRESQAIAMTWLGPDHPAVVRTAAEQAELARRRGGIAEAIALARTTLERFAAAGLSEHPAAIDTRLTLGQALLSASQFAAARTELAASLASAKRQFVATDPRIALAADGLARAGARHDLSASNKQE